MKEFVDVDKVIHISVKVNIVDSTYSKKDEDFEVTFSNQNIFK